MCPTLAPGPWVGLTSLHSFLMLPKKTKQSERRWGESQSSALEMKQLSSPC